MGRMTPRDVIRKHARPLRDGFAQHYEKASPDRCDAIDDALIYMAHYIAGPYLSGYPTPEVGARIILGATPASLAPGLTKREARAWASQSEHETPVAWLIAQTGEDFRADDMAVARWVARALASKKRRGAMLKHIRRTDELTPADLVKSISETFRRAEIRQALNQWDGPNELIKHEPWHDDLPDGVRVLRTALELFYEGAQQHHCIGDYAERVYAGRCLVVSVRAGDDRSTAEVVDGRVMQHLGAFNLDPPAACVALLASVSRWS